MHLFIACSPCATLVVSIQSSVGGCSTGTAFKNIYIYTHVFDIFLLLFRIKSQRFRWRIFTSVTFHHAQVYVELVVIEPSWDLHSAAVRASISPLSVNDGQGHVSVRHPSPQQVPGGLPVEHGPVLGGQDGVGTFGHGHLPPSPAETLDAVSLGVIAAGQSHIVTEATEDFDGAWRHCGGKRWTFFKNRMTQSAVVFLKKTKSTNAATLLRKNTNAFTPTASLQIEENKTADIDLPWVTIGRITKK